MPSRPQGIVCGHVQDIDQLSALGEACDAVGLKLFAPSWGAHPLHRPAELLVANGARVLVHWLRGRGLAVRFDAAAGAVSIGCTPGASGAGTGTALGRVLATEADVSEVVEELQGLSAVADDAHFDAIVTHSAEYARGVRVREGEPPPSPRCRDAVDPRVAGPTTCL